MREPGEAGSRGDGARKKSKSLSAGSKQHRLFDDVVDDDVVDDPKPLVKKRLPNQFITRVKAFGNDVSREAARDAAKKFGGLSWRFKESKAGSLIYTCDMHKECKAQLKLKYEGQIGPELYVNGEAHTVAFKEVPFKGKGLGGEWVDEVRSLKSGGLGAKGIRHALTHKYLDVAATVDLAKAARIPIETVLEAHIASNLRGDSLLLSNAEMCSYTASMMVRSVGDIEKAQPDALLVIANFSRKVEVPVLDEEGDETGETVTKTTLGFICATRKMLLWLRDLILSLENGESPRQFTWTIAADGTYKLCKGNTKAGAVLVDLGIHDVTYKKALGRDTHNFLPLLYMYCQVECFEAYELLFATLKDLPNKLLGLPGKQITPAFGGLDRASYIAKAYLSVWPGSLESEPEEL